MPAYIIEGAQLAFSIAQHDDALAEHIQHLMRARARHLFLAADTQPLTAEDAFFLEGKHLLRSIPTRRQGRLEAGHRRGQLVSTHALIPSGAVMAWLRSGASRRKLRVEGFASSSRA